MEDLNDISSEDLQKEINKRNKEKEDAIKEEERIRLDEEKKNTPKLIEEPDLSSLQEMATNTVEYMNETGCYEKDIEQYMFESVMTTFYGKDIFNHLNKMNN
jgi:hypothetical protein